MSLLKADKRKDVIVFCGMAALSSRREEAEQAIRSVVSAMRTAQFKRVADHDIFLSGLHVVINDNTPLSNKAIEDGEEYSFAAKALKSEILNINKYSTNHFKVTVTIADNSKGDSEKFALIQDERSTAIAQALGTKYSSAEEQTKIVFFSFDDDLFYPDSYIVDALGWLFFAQKLISRKVAVSYHSRTIVNKITKSYYKDTASVGTALGGAVALTKVDFCGTGCTVFELDHQLFSELLIPFPLPYAADVFFALACQRAGYSRWQLPHFAGYLRYLRNGKCDTIWDAKSTADADITNFAKALKKEKDQKV